MTTLKKPVRRETAVLVRRRPLIVELQPRFMTLREKGRAARFNVDYGAIFDLARKLAAREDTKGRW